MLAIPIIISGDLESNLFVEMCTIEERQAKLCTVLGEFQLSHINNLIERPLLQQSRNVHPNYDFTAAVFLHVDGANKHSCVQILHSLRYYRSSS